MDAWRPQPRQRLFEQCPAFEALFGGSKGGGKSDCLLQEGTRQIHKGNYKAKIFRRTYPELQDLIDRSHQRFYGWASWNGEKRRWTWPSGATLGFYHCQHERDKYNHQGQETHYLAFDQLEQFTFSQYMFLMSQIRTSDPTIRCYIRGSANPGGVGHAWVKERFIDKLNPNGLIRWFIREKLASGDEIDVETYPHAPFAVSRAYVFSRVYDNQKLLSADPSYLHRLMMLPETDRKALLEGDWDAFVGQYFREWRREVHIIPYHAYKAAIAGLNIKRFISLDYGFAAPASIGWYALLPDSKLIRYRELYVERHTYKMLGERIREMSKEDGRLEKIDYLVADPAIWGDKKHHDFEPKDGIARGESGFDVLSKALRGLCPVMRGDNRRLVGWNKVRAHLAVYKDQHDQLASRFYVTDNCHNFKRTIPGLIHDEIDPEDVDTKGEDHAADEFRYLVMTRPALPQLPPVEPTEAEAFWARVKADTTKLEAERSPKDSLENREQEIMEEGSSAVSEGGYISED